MRTSKLLTLTALILWTVLVPCHGQTVEWARKADGREYVVVCPPPDLPSTTNYWPNNNNWSQDEHWGLFCTPPHTNSHMTQPSNWNTPGYPNGPTYDVILGSSGGTPTHLDVSVTVHSLTIRPDGALDAANLTTLMASAFDFQGDGVISVSGGGGPPLLKIADGGSMTKSGGTGTLTIDADARLVGYGATISVQSGTLALPASTCSYTNVTLIAASNATLNLVGTNQSGSGSAWLYGTLTGSGDGTVLCSAGKIHTGAGGATLDFPGPLFQWTGGGFDSDYPLTNLGTINASGSAPKSLAANLNNRGTLNYDGSGDLVINYSAGGRLNNLASGTVNLQSNATIYSSTGGGAIANWGLFRKPTGTSTSTVSMGFNNLSGTVQVDSGTLSLAGGGASSSSNGTFNVSANAVLDLTGGAATPTYYRGTFTGSGGGTVLLGSGSINAASGDLTLNFPGSLFKWTGGGFGGSYALTNLGTINASGSAAKSLATDLNNSGTFNYGGSGDLVINYSAGGRLNNLASGTVNL
jgi:hypothetical protein